jgi:hypothetical protein
MYRPPLHTLTTRVMPCGCGTRSYYPCAYIRRRRGSAFDGPARRARAPAVRGRRRLARSKWCQPDAEQRCAPRAAGLSMTRRILSRTDRGDSNYGVQKPMADTRSRESEKERQGDGRTASYTWSQLVPIRHLYLTSTSDYLASWKAKITNNHHIWGWATLCYDFRKVPA